MNSPVNEFSFSKFLNTHREEIICLWVEKLHTEAGEQYAARPIEELERTIKEAVEANYQVLVHDNYKYINMFIDKITAMRLKAGFSLSDVQKAFELYRVIVIKFFINENLSSKDLLQSISGINKCLAYTMHRFSDHFQDMHQKKIIEQNIALEQIVKKRTAALEESEKKYKTLVEEINDGYFVIQNEMIVFANKAFYHMHGCKPEEVQGKKFTSFVAQSDRDQVMKMYAGDSAGVAGDVSTQVFRYKRRVKSGEEFPTEIHGITTTYDNKLSSIGICRDITDRVDMEKKIRENERMAYIGQITASLSHEIRNPLSAIKLNLQIFKKNKKIVGYDKRRVDISVSEVIRLEHILNDLLDFAKPLQMNMMYCNICELLKSYVELLDMKFKENEIKVITQFNEYNPDIWIDKEKFGQAIINILINAIEASEPFSKIVIKYTIELKKSTGFAQIVIEDEGISFDEEKSADMFKPFFTTKTKGVGLGLANVKRIIEAHNGYVFINKREPQGATFSIMIPAKTREITHD